MKQFSLALFMAIAACAGQRDTNPAAPQGDAALNASFTAADAVEALRNAGLAPQAAGTIQQPFFAIPAQVHSIDGGDLQLYEFPSAAEASSAAAKVSPNGGSVGTTMATWMAPPHFFRRERVMAIYIGTSAKSLAALQKVFGPQFAGS